MSTFAVRRSFVIKIGEVMGPQVTDECHCTLRRARLVAVDVDHDQRALFRLF